ncbi:hypothetical protein BJV78DRAFT_1248458 [Lactifluus subvellereus]|nr:hypothetical protein BJV78DRAFT_1248458 [Lactifluus subvellereus]
MTARESTYGPGPGLSTLLRSAPRARADNAFLQHHCIKVKQCCTPTKNECSTLRCGVACGTRMPGYITV